MSSLSASNRFLCHLGFSRSDASSLMHHFGDEMSRLITTSHGDLLRSTLSLSFDQRLRILIAIRCFHMEKWSKYLMNRFDEGNDCLDPFETFVFHLLKYHIWIDYTSWSMKYIDKYLMKTDESDKNMIKAMHQTSMRLEKSFSLLQQQLLRIRNEFC